MQFESNQNLLLNGKSDNIRKSLFQTALSFAEDGTLVFYMTSKRIEKLPIDIKDKNTLRKIIFMYFHSYESLLKYILDLSNWNTTPKLIIIELLNEIIQCETIKLEDFIEKHSIIIAALQNVVNCNTKKVNEICYSIVSIDAKSSDHYKNILPVLIDLYYYKNNCYIDGVQNWDTNILNEYFLQ